MRPRRRTGRLRIGVACAVLLAGCDASDHTPAPPVAEPPARTLPLNEDGSPAEPPRPASTEAGCAVLPADLLGRTLGYAVALNDNATGNCLVTAADGAPAAPAIDFRIESRTGAFDYFSGQPDAAPIPGLGDRALWATLTETTGTVVALVGTRTVVVSIAQADGVGANARRRAEAVARLLVERLR